MTQLLLRALLAAIICTVGCSRAEVQHSPSTRPYDVQHYSLNLTFAPESRSFHGTVQIVADITQPSDQMVVDAAGTTLTIDSVLHNRTRLSFEHKDDIASIRLPDPNASRVTITIAFHGISTFTGTYDAGGVNFTRGKEGYRIATISQPNFARTWWPCNDTPSDKATATITISVPESLIAVSNGVLNNRYVRDGLSTSIWNETYPISTYLISFAAAKYVELTDTYVALDGSTMPLHYFVYPEDSANASAAFRHTNEILHYFASTFCEYPFLKEKFGYAEVDGDLTMENQTIVSVEQTLITESGEGLSTIVHETAHQWWGNLITPVSWKHTWLNEGFATYAEMLFIEQRKGAPAYQQYVDAILKSRSGSFAGSVIGQNESEFWDSFSARVYTKGAIVLHMLRRMLGDSVFFAAMRNYLKDERLRYSTASTDDFIRIIEHTSGRNLRWFFDQWVYANTSAIDRPELSFAWNSVQMEESSKVSITVTQKTASVLLYRLPFTFFVSTGGGEYAFPVVDSLAVQEFTFMVPHPPQFIVPDRNHDIFMTIHEEGK